MRSHRLVTYTASLALGITLTSATALADPTHAQPAREEQGYGYAFKDDPLQAGGFGALDATIITRPGAIRATLIRPRTQFVIEMLKSVENL